MRSSSPNILLVCTDQQSGWAMSGAGNNDLHTPALDRLANRGVRFTQAYCPQPLCGPCRASMMSGRMPHEIGATFNATGIDEAFRERELGRVFQANGYATAYAGKWHIPKSSLDDDNDHGFEAICPINDHDVADRCIEYLKRPHERPFLLVASFDNPHNICEYARNQPLPWGDIEEPPLDCCPNLPANFAIPPHEPQLIRTVASGDRAIWPSVDYTSEHWRRLRNAYYRLCEKVDAQIGRLFDTVEQSSLNENTVIVFLSDHGEMAGAHQLNQKTFLYEESVRVPMIVSPTGGGTGSIDDRHLVNIGLDLMPTLLDYAGITGPSDLQGRSLRPLVTGSTTQTEWRRELVAQTTCQAVSTLGNRHTYGRMLRTERYKYIVYSFGLNREQLFDLHDDPGEMVDLSVETRYAHVLNDHRQRLAAICEQSGDTFKVPHREARS